MPEQGSKAPSWWRRFRWLYAARCTVACVVTLVAVAVIVRAVVVMLRPEKLQLKLAGGRVAVDYIPSLPPPRNVVVFRVLLRANNPGGRATIVYANVTVRLTDASAGPAATITEFDLPQRIDVAQRMAHEATAVAELEPGEDLPMRYVRTLYEGRGVAGAEMELSGVLSTHTAMATTSVLTTYYCWPVTIAVVAGDSAADVPCFDKLDAPAHV
ncbi:hypothetical protein CFC21_095488 [Triticum aestivum]|uniref:Late embryogenesis abundant protein LEA-2 subgroup domain-containing protein n=2 Tax=Triticum aestivum TaxID=4565 RepID=A0A9R1LQ87_WHEAT|nr:uncharacterized protein LOC123150614 [Triticum aestivum]KAF7093052.1 hypothetical protein CFC21_095488 [Triticum aestivum]